MFQNQCLKMVHGTGAGVRLSRRQDVSFDSYNGVTVHGSDNVYGKALRRMAFTKPNVEAGLSK